MSRTSSGAHTGYLTIDRAEVIGPRWLHQLRYPNLELEGLAAGR